VPAKANLNQRGIAPVKLGTRTEAADALGAL